MFVNFQTKSFYITFFRPLQMLESPDSPVVVWSRPPSLRSLRTGKRVVPGQYVLDEPDTLCVLPSSMRIVCCLLTLLLILSLIAAILNSLQGSSNGSVSYCKRPDEPFRPDILWVNFLKAHNFVQSCNMLLTENTIMNNGINVNTTYINNEYSVSTY